MQAHGELALDVRWDGCASGEYGGWERLLVELALGGEGDAAEVGVLAGAKGDEVLPHEADGGSDGGNADGNEADQGEAGSDRQFQFHSAWVEVAKVSMVSKLDSASDESNGEVAW